MAKQAIDKQAGNKSARLIRSYRNEGFALLASIHEEVKGKIAPEILPEIETPEARRRGANKRKTDATGKVEGEISFYPIGNAGAGDLASENSVGHAMSAPVNAENN